MQIKLKNRQAELQAHCDKYGLKRDYSRELVQEQVTKTLLTKSTKNGSVIGAKTSYGTELKYNPDAIYKIDVEEYSDEVNKGLSQAAANVANGLYKGIEKMEDWATNTMKHNPWWRDNMSPDEYDKEREYYFKNFDSLVKNGKYTPLWKQNI